MKRWIFIAALVILSAAAAFSLSACGNGGSGDQSLQTADADDPSAPVIGLPEDVFDDIETGDGDDIIIGEDDTDRDESRSADTTGNGDNDPRPDSPPRGNESGVNNSDSTSPIPSDTEKPDNATVTDTSENGKNGASAGSDNTDPPEKRDDGKNGASETADPLFEEIVGGGDSQGEIVLPPDPFG